MPSHGVRVAAYFLVLFSYGRAAFSDEFSVARTALKQLRERWARAPAPREAS